MKLHLMSHTLCPYVQRAVIALTEKGVEFERTYIDLANQPEWFVAISPLGMTPVLTVDGKAIFESSVILEYLEETQPNPLHPVDPLTRARHRAWIEFGSAVLNDIAGFYNAKTHEDFDAKASALRAKFKRLESELGDGEFFDNNRFSLVDAVFGPVFRYFDCFDQIGDFGFFAETPKVRRWREVLSRYPSVREAVSTEYPEQLVVFLEKRNSYLTNLVNIPSEGTAWD